MEKQTIIRTSHAFFAQKKKKGQKWANMGSRVLAEYQRNKYYYRRSR